MVGLGSRRAGHRTGMYSAAAEVMESLSEYTSFLAVFRVQGAYWLVAVRNGIILHDQLFDSEFDARAEYEKLSKIPDWGVLFAPDEWAMPRATEKRIADVVTGNLKVSLKSISRAPANFISVALAVLFLIGIVHLFKEPISQMLAPKPQVAAIDPKLAEEYKKRIEEKNKELDQKFEIKKEKPLEPLAMPYDSLPDPMDRAQVCYQAIAFLMQPVAGWVQTNVDCGEMHANVTFKRGFGNLADFYEIAGELMPGVFVQEKSDSEIYVTAKLPELQPTSSLEEKDVDTIIREVNTTFQRLDMSVDTNSVIDTIADETRSVNLNVVEVGASSKLTPPEFMKIFEDFGGVYMTRTKWDARSRTWNYEVIIYAK